MRRKICIALVLCTMCAALAGCGAKRQPLPTEPVIFQKGEFCPPGEESGYATVEYDGKRFILYGGIRPRGPLRDLSYAFGDCLGHVEGDENERIFALKGCSPDEWLIEYYEGGIMEQPMVMREIGTRGGSSLPDSVESFGYEYWN